MTGALIREIQQGCRSGAGTVERAAGQPLGKGVSGRGGWVSLEGVVW